jgi:hypothetical protein
MAITDDLLALGNEEIATRIGKSARTVATTFRPLLEVIGEGEGGKTPEQIAASLGWTVKRVSDALTALVAKNLEIFDLTAQFMPSVPTVIDLVERQLGAIGGGNLAAANVVCAEIVVNIIRPRYGSFLRRALHAHIDAGTDLLSLPVDDLVSFLLGDYRTFVKAQEQGLISKVGGLNEAILARGLTNSGLVRGTDFDVTGKRGNGDLAVYCNVTVPRVRLLVEVKSYGARERLLRGLQDIDPPKVGVGFFNRANEFNGERTTQFLGTQSLAIYMPRGTYDGLDEPTRARTNHRGSRFYRPLDDFVADIRSFTQRGEAAY